MRLLIVLVSEDPDLRRLFERRKQGVLRDALASRYYALRAASADTRTYPVETGVAADLEKFVRGASVEAQAILVLHDEAGEGLVEGLRTAALISPFHAAEARDNPENLLQREIAKGLRNLAALGGHLGRSDDQKILLLPLRNFHAPELTELERLVLAHAATATFIEGLDRSLAEIRRLRQRPKPAGRNRGKYLVDDRERHFQYGFEKHARVETAGGGHAIPCDLNSRFRFGHRYDDERHYNVSARDKDEPFEGEILNCHDDPKHLKRKTHLNLFPNGYYT